MKREKYNENNGTKYPRTVENHKRFNHMQEKKKKREREKREKEAEEVFE